jgi:hypothetical protein
VENVSIDVRYTVDDYVRGLTYIQNRSIFARYGFVLLPGIILLFFIFNLFINQRSLWQLSSYVILVTALPVVVIFVVLLLLRYFPNPLLKWNVKKQFKSSPLLNEVQHLKFDGNGISGKTNLSEGTTKWQAIIECSETNDDIFFFTSKKFAMFVPKSQLSSNQLAEIKVLATANLNDRVRFQ